MNDIISFNVRFEIQGAVIYLHSSRSWHQSFALQVSIRIQKGLINDSIAHELYFLLPGESCTCINLNFSPCKNLMLCLRNTFVTFPQSVVAGEHSVFVLPNSNSLSQVNSCSCWFWYWTLIINKLSETPFMFKESEWISVSIPILTQWASSRHEKVLIYIQPIIWKKVIAQIFEMINKYR